MECSSLGSLAHNLVKALVFAGVCVAGAHTASAQKTTPTKDCDQACVDQHIQAFNQEVAAKCAADLAAYNQIHALAISKQAPDIPEPPTFDPPCQSCDEANGPAPTPPEVQTWIDDSLKPESTLIKQLQSIGKDVTLASGSQDLSSANQKCLNKLPSDYDVFNDGNKLLKRNWKKAQSMTDYYSTEDERAYAALEFITQDANQYEAGFCTNLDANMKGCESQSAEPDDRDSLMEKWLTSVTESVNNKIFQQHQYNFCPTYMSSFRVLAMLGSNQNEAELAKLQETMTKIRDFLHFQVTLDVKGYNSGRGASTSVSWQATGKFHIDIDQQKSCYTPTMDGPIQATVTNYSVPNVTLISPRSFSLAVDKLVLTMCDPKPLFVIRFKDTPPYEEVQAGGRTTKAGLIAEPFGVALATPTLDLYGKDAKNASINTSSSYGLPSNSGPAQVDPTKEIQAHKGDPSWFLTAQGQQALQQMQAQVMQKVQGSAAATDILSGGVNYSPATLRVNWTNGNGNPVDALLSPQIQSNNGDGSTTNSVQVKVVQQSQ